MTSPQTTQDIKINELEQMNKQLRDALSVLEIRNQAYHQTVNDVVHLNMELKAGQGILQKQMNDIQQSKLSELAAQQKVLDMVKKQLDDANRENLELKDKLAAFDDVNPATQDDLAA